MDVINLKWILIDGLLLSAGLGISMLIALCINPRIMLQDYPEEIERKVAPQTQGEKRQQLVLGLVWLALVLIAFIHFMVQLRMEATGRLSFPILFIDYYLLFTVLNIIDTVILDLLILSVWKPRALLIPEAQNFAFIDAVHFHGIAFLKGIIIGIVPSLIATVLSSLLS